MFDGKRPDLGHHPGQAVRNGRLEADFPAVDLADGVIWKEGVEVAPSTVTIHNANAHDASDGAKLVYYEVTASRCPDGSGQTPYIVTDPMVRNTGK